MEWGCDVGMQRLDFGRERDSFHSMTSVSIGVAVPCNIPKIVSPTQVCNGRQMQPGADIGKVLVGEEDGIAVPVTIPEVSSLTQVCNGRWTQPDMDIEKKIVIGDEEDEE
jgi:hypothetical protein